MLWDLHESFGAPGVIPFDAHDCPCYPMTSHPQAPINRADVAGMRRGAGRQSGTVSPSISATHAAPCRGGGQKGDGPGA
jgi:hypothetical protein